MFDVANNTQVYIYGQLAVFFFAREKSWSNGDSFLLRLNIKCVQLSDAFKHAEFLRLLVIFLSLNWWTSVDLNQFYI